MAYRISPLEPDRSILVVGLNGKVFGLDRASGQIRWRTMLSATGEVFLVVARDVVIASDFDQTIACLDYSTGAERWRRRTHSGGRATIVVEPDQIVCAKSGYLDCFSLDGQPLWSQPLEGEGLGVVALGYPGNVAQADESG